MAPRFPTPKRPGTPDRSADQRSVSRPRGPDSVVLLLGEERRETAEAALPPSEVALDALRALRAVHGAERAFKAAEAPEEIARLRASLEQAEEALRAALRIFEGTEASPPGPAPLRL